MGKTIGIDLGTTNSVVAIMEGAEPKVLTNEEGGRTTPSVVGFGKDGEVMVGQVARRQAITNPENTVYSIKRFMGRHLNEVPQEIGRVPYKVIPGDNDMAYVNIDGKKVSPPEVSAKILQKLKRAAETYLGQPVTEAVITVPAYFNDAQRQATKDAGRIAGLEVKRIINEPTAAALAYGMDKKKDEVIAVYDFGGGTFDISILEVGENVVEVLSTNGDTHLGGDDIDMRLLDYFADLFMSQTNINLRTDVSALQRLRDVAEETKKAFSQKKKVKVQVPEVFTDPQGRVHNFETVVDHETFTKLTMDLVQRTFKVCDEAFQSAGMSVHDVDAVILVGGPTRLPLVRDSARHYFGREPNTEVDPDEVVALGAAIEGASLVDENASAFLLDVTPLTLRLGTVGGYSEQIIPKNSPVPIDRTRTFTTSRDGQERVQIRVFQGESNRVEQNEMLAEFAFAGFRAAPRGEVQIEVTFEIDANGIVNVSARDPETGQSASTTVTLSSGLTEDEIQASAERVRGAELV